MVSTMLAAVKVVTYEEWARRRQSAAEGQIVRLPSDEDKMPSGGDPTGIVDVSADTPTSPFGPVRRPAPRPSGAPPVDTASAKDVSKDPPAGEG